MLPRTYGASEQSSLHTHRHARAMLTTSLVAIVMMVAVVFWASGSDQSSPVEEIAVPDDDLKSLVVNLAEQGTTMSVGEMEQRLELWRAKPSSLLDLPEPDRTQERNNLQMIFFKTGNNSHPFVCRCWQALITPLMFILRVLPMIPRYAPKKT